ncbi:hypothetical protein BO78DRAFT_224071 [Aspergillus sclerotiicarbonarius CBS 121057]|uniref:Uncharacterized protein n=1 Tax=Aspergillus sclerotiicarbonarius (strain CBS 121057 / IBT 28362) TaxID=1448318 RepID=A0A319DX47_ASPSB|nr:hypothetical protein BO78DRAFT_224071 [Aspergillus sclerotiicarbonarius CBS 121057]
MTVEAGRNHLFFFGRDYAASYEVLRNRHPSNAEPPSGEGFEPTSAALEYISKLLDKTMILMDSGHILLADGETVQARPGDQVIMCEGDEQQFLILRSVGAKFQLIQTGRYDFRSFGRGMNTYLSDKVKEVFTII